MKKKKAIIMSVICFILVVILIVFGVYKLNTKKLKGELKEYKDYNAGEEFCLGTECFLVMDDDGDTVIALAKYNLVVGKKVRANYYDGSFHYEVLETYDENTPGYNLQSSEMRGATYIDGVIVDGTEWAGTVSFSDLDLNANTYWNNTYSSPLPQYGDKYPAYVFDENSNIWPYIYNYNNYLLSEGFTSVVTSLPSTEQIKNVTCTDEECANSFTYTSFWLGDAVDSMYISSVTTQPSTPPLARTWYYNDNMLGVRPAITIDKSQIPGSLVSVPDSECINFEEKDNYELGDVISICNSNLDKREDFYVISDTEDEIVALAKYNLAVGTITKTYIYNDELNFGKSWELSTSKPYYNLQDSRFHGGLVEGTWYGTLAFSSENYWDGSVEEYPTKVYGENSELYQYVNTYDSYLNNILGQGVVDVSIPDLEMVRGLGCSFTDDEGTCENAPEWLHSTAYWLQDAIDERNMLVIVGGYYDSSGGIISYVPYSTSNYVGIRPLITIHKDRAEETTTETPTTTVQEVTEPTPSGDDETTTTATTTEATTSKSGSVTTKKQAQSNNKATATGKSVVTDVETVADEVVTAVDDNKDNSKVLTKNIVVTNTTTDNSVLFIVLCAMSPLLLIILLILTMKIIKENTN